MHGAGDAKGARGGRAQAPKTWSARSRRYQDAARGALVTGAHGERDVARAAAARVASPVVTRTSPEKWAVAAPVPTAMEPEVPAMPALAVRTSSVPAVS